MPLISHANENSKNANIDKRWDCTKDMQLPAQTLFCQTLHQGPEECFRYANMLTSMMLRQHMVMNSHLSPLQYNGVQQGLKEMLLGVTML